MENFIITMTYLLIGIIIKKIPSFSKETGNVLNLFVIYVSLPALIFIKIPLLKFEGDILILAVIPWVCLVLSFFITIGWCKIFKWDKSTTGCLLLLVPIGNTAFFGIPMVHAFFGDTLTSYALIYDQAGSFLALTTYGSFILALYGKNAAKPTFKNISLKIFCFPPFIALIMALLIKNIPYPKTAATILNALSDTLVPLVMIAVGYQLSFKLKKDVMASLSFGLVIKLLIMPLFALGVCMVWGLNSQAAQVAVFQAGMPSMVTAGALAIMADLKTDLAAALVGIGIILSFLTLPFIYSTLKYLG